MAEQTRTRRTRRTRREEPQTVTKRKVEVVEEVEDVEEEEEVEETPKPSSRRRRSGQRVVVKAEEEVEEEDDIEEVEEDESDGAQTFNSAADVIASLKKGVPYQITLTDGGFIVMVLDGTTAASKIRKSDGLKGKAFTDEVYSDEYKEFQERWQAMSAEEKEAEVKKAKVKWEKHDHPATNAMRMVMAYQDHLGLEKYKPEYASRAARQALKEGR